MTYHRFSAFTAFALMFFLAAGTGCTNFGNVMTHPEVEVQSLKVIQMTPDETRMLAVLSFENPNPLSLRLKRLEYRLHLDRVPLITGTMESLPLVKNQRIQTIEVPMIIQTQTLMAALPLSPKNPGQHKYHFAGRALAFNEWASAPMMFDSEGQMMLPVLPTFKFNGLECSKDGRKPEFGLEITNPNNFVLKLRKLQGQLELSSHAYTWQFQPKEINLAANQSLRLHIPCRPNETADAKMDAEIIQKGSAMPYWIQGELECNSPHGIIIVVIHEKGSIGK